MSIVKMLATPLLQRALSAIALESLALVRPNSLARVWICERSVSPLGTRMFPQL